MFVLDTFSVTGAGGSGTPIICGANDVRILPSCILIIIELHMRIKTKSNLGHLKMSKQNYYFLTLL